MVQLDRSTTADDISEDIKHLVEDEVEEHAKVQRQVNHWVYIIGIIGPLLILPQLLKIVFVNTAAGVSIISWIGYLVLAASWFGYGIAYKNKPIITVYGVWLVINVLMVYVIYFYQ